MNFDDFHQRHIAQLLAAGQGGPGARLVGAGASLSIRLLDGSAYTYRSTGSDLVVGPGEDADVIVELTAEAFEDLVTEAWSVYGLLYGDRLNMRKGEFNAFAQWEAPLQALWFGRPVYGAEAVAQLVDRQGARLDLGRQFAMDDDPDELRHHLSVAGFLVVRRVFSADEINDLNTVVQVQLSSACPGDGRSWWATRSDGDEVCCRLTYMAERTPITARLASDLRMRRLADLADPRLLPCTDRLDGMSVVIKHPDIVAGLSDLPWHRDCGVGGHRVLCPGLNVGVQLDRADAANGQLHFLAGSHHHAAQQGLPTDLDPAPTVAVDAEPGDVTVHYGHVLHAAPPPTSPTAGRKAMYLGYHLPAAFAAVGPGQAYNDVLVNRDGGRVRSVDEVTTG